MKRHKYESDVQASSRELPGCGSCNDDADGCDCCPAQEDCANGVKGYVCACDACAGEEDGCACCGESNEPERAVWPLVLLRLGISAALLICARFIPMPFWVSLTLFILSYLTAGYEILWHALRNLFRGRVFDENFLMTIATVGAFSIGDFSEGIAVMLFYQLGEMFQGIAVHRSRRSISALLNIRPDFARKLTGDTTEVCSPEEISVGDLIMVNPGERVPLDGIVVSGSSLLDTAALTGESVPRAVGQDEEVLSGSINQTAALTVKVTKPFAESTVSRILELTQNAASKKADTEKFITRFARVYTPIVCLAALLTAVVPPLFIGFDTFPVWFYRALTFLVISCPCALVISIPLGFFGGIGGASIHGILVKGSNSLEALRKVTAVALDKTGTLTKGKFSVSRILPADNISEDSLLSDAALCEMRSSHPIAKSILERFGSRPDESLLADFIEHAGQGIEVILKDGIKLLAGSRKLMDAFGVSLPAPESLSGTVVLIARNGVYEGAVEIADSLKETSAAAVKALKALGVSRIVMLTGDAPETAALIAKQAGITEWKAGLLPQDKVAAVEDLMANKEPGEKFAFVGDGINDAPVIAGADVGISMGGIGSDAAIEAADIVLMTDDLLKLPLGIRIARKTGRIVKQNIVFALGIKALILLLSIFGFASMWMAIFADVGVALIAVLNALRSMRIRP